MRPDASVRSPIRAPPAAISISTPAAPAASLTVGQAMSPTGRIGEADAVEDEVAAIVLFKQALHETIAGLVHIKRRQVGSHRCEVVCVCLRARCVV